MQKFADIPQSKIFAGIEWLSDRIGYADKDVKGDTYPMTWADDDEIHTSAGDPLWGESQSGMDVEKFVGGPENYVIHKTNHMNEYIGWGGSGPKPSGMICVDGLLYLAFQNFKGTQPSPFSILSQHGSDAYILFADRAFPYWRPAYQHIKEPMFSGHFFGGPAFVHFGKARRAIRTARVCR